MGFDLKLDCYFSRIDMGEIIFGKQDGTSITIEGPPV